MNKFANYVKFCAKENSIIDFTMNSMAMTGAGYEGKVELAPPLLWLSRGYRISSNNPKIWNVLSVFANIQRSNIQRFCIDSTISWYPCNKCKISLKS